MSIWKVTVLVVLLVLWATVSSAQYFGRNKVQYEKFDFKVLTTEHVDIYYYPEEEPAVQLAARMAERWSPGETQHQAPSLRASVARTLRHQTCS